MYHHDVLISHICVVRNLLKSLHILYLYFYRSEEESHHEETGDEISEVDEEVHLSEYELLRKKWIEENKRQFEEHFENIKNKICLADFHELSTL